MKTIFKILIVIAFLSVFAQNANAIDTLNPCWDMYFRHDPANGYNNPDSVLYDSCFCKNRLIERCDSIYAKQWFEIIFNNKDPFGLPKFPEDTIIEPTWQELDSSYVDLRNMFQNLENIFGAFILRKRYPNITDSTALGSRGYLIKFQNYNNINNVLSYFENSNLLYTYHYQNRCFYNPDNIQDIELKLKDISIYPIPCNNVLTISFSMDNFYNLNLRIIDLLGENYYNLNNLKLQSNNQILHIKTENIPEGIYFCIIDAGKYRYMKKFIKIK